MPSNPRASAKSDLSVYDEDFYNYLSKYFTDKGLPCPMKCGYVTPHGKKNHQLLATHYLSCSRQSFQCAVPMCTNICRPDILYLFKCGHGFFCMTCLFYQEAQGTELAEIMCDFYQIPYENEVRRPCAKLCFVEDCNETEIVKCKPNCIQYLESVERNARKFLKDQDEVQHIDNSISKDRLSRKQASELKAQEFMRKEVEARKIRNDDLMESRRLRREIIVNETSRVLEQKLKLAKIDSTIEVRLATLAQLIVKHGDDNGDLQDVIDETMKMREQHRVTQPPVSTASLVFTSDRLVNGNGIPHNSDYRFDNASDKPALFYNEPVFEKFSNISASDYDNRINKSYSFGTNPENYSSTSKATTRNKSSSSSKKSNKLEKTSSKTSLKSFSSSASKLGNSFKMFFQSSASKIQQLVSPREDEGEESSGNKRDVNGLRLKKFKKSGKK